MGTDVDTSPKVRAEVAAFLKAHGAKKVVAVPEILGCPHEEGEDFPGRHRLPLLPVLEGQAGDRPAGRPVLTARTLGCTDLGHRGSGVRGRPASPVGPESRPQATAAGHGQARVRGRLEVVGRVPGQQVERAGRPGRPLRPGGRTPWSSPDSHGPAGPARSARPPRPLPGASRSCSAQRVAPGPPGEPRQQAAAPTSPAKEPGSMWCRPTSPLLGQRDRWRLANRNCQPNSAAARGYLRPGRPAGPPSASPRRPRPARGPAAATRAGGPSRAGGPAEA